MLEYFISWWTTPQLVEYLNDWNEIQGEFLNQKFGNIDVIKFRNKFSTIYFFVTVGSSAVFLLMSDVHFLDDFPIFFVIRETSCVLSTIAYVTDDIKVVLMLKCVERGFSEIHKQIQATNFTSKVQLRNPHKLILMIRSQAESIGKYLTISQLLSIMFSIYIASATVYICVKLVTSSEWNAEYYAVIGQMSFFSVFHCTEFCSKFGLRQI
ncbi:hypothetical protein Fcan01_25508 [Folsomia candida]|uniref:Uncharacterized protein n=1 Tax=Folsomia candida TaxID=158441 RepID=A0A226D3N2_FOLCA|nr:hypothetical protein Fcan01_25508 [Folsomia candida]